MSKRTLVLTGVAVAAVVLLTGAGTQAGVPLSHINHLTFSGPVQLPGAVLTPGTYTFEAGPNGTNRNIVRVMTRSGGTVIFQGFTVPTTRMGAGPTVSFGEAPAGSPAPIAAWYENGATMGHLFSYR